MLFSYNWIQSFFSKKLLEPKKLAELLTMRAFEVEEIQKIGKDWSFDIDITPNRGQDCFSHLGIVREISAITGLDYKDLLSIIKKTKDTKTKDFIKIDVKDKDVCKRYTIIVISGIKVEPSPKYIQEKLRVCGLQAINNIVDAVNYIMLETGQPMHVFDFDKIEQGSGSKKIIIRKAEKREKIWTLDDGKYDLNKEILIIADSKEPLAIAGIKGGKKAEIDKQTKTILLESANFDAKAIRRCSKLLNLKTDASWRFEHNLDPNLTEVAINRVASLIQEIAGGKIALDVVDFYPKKVYSKKIQLSLDYAERLLGVRISEKKIIKILRQLDFKTSFKTQGIIEVEVPTFRRDISIPEDLIEEIGRIYGYENIRSILPISSLTPSKRNTEFFWQKNIKDALKEAGFFETYNYSFLSEKDVRNFGYRKEELLEIENPVTVEQKYLRPSLIPGLFKNVKSNLKTSNSLNFFEIGRVFSKKQQEKTMLAGVIVKGLNADKELFYEIKGVIDLLLNKLGISDIWYDEYKPTTEESNINTWHPFKRAELKVNGKKIGFIGEISLRVLQDINIKKTICVFNINLEKLITQCSEEQTYRPISAYPAAVRDIAILLPAKTKVVDVLNKINNSGGELVIDVDLFDIYEGGELPGGKKNLAFHIIYQAKDRTLTTKEINEIQQKIIKALEQEPSWQVRK